MKLTGESKLFLGMIGATAVILAIAMFIFSQPPKPLPKSDLVIPTAASRGNKNASHYLVEFSDFECPACKAFSVEVDAISKKYLNQLLIVYRHFPLPQHSESRKAALAAEAAGVQGKFWEMERLLFDNQIDLNDAIYASLAAQIKLDPVKFNQSLNDPTLAEKIQADVNYGDKLGINSTPTFYLDGVKLTLTVPADLSSQVMKIIK
jgi:protein-disulfide isomerase